MRIKVCHAHCEHCGHSAIPDLDLQLHQSADGVFSTAAVCRDEDACTARQNGQTVVARAS